LLIGHKDEQCDAPMSRIGRFLIASFLTATSVIASVELNRSAHEPMDVGSLSQDRVLDGASCSMANNSPDGGESMQGLAEIIQPAIGN
jgi:hypothetical protein